MGNDKVLFVNYEKFQWISNLKMMSKFAEDPADSNILTLRDAIHYTATDLPALMSKTYLKYPMGFLEWAFGGRKSSDDRLGS